MIGRAFRNIEWLESKGKKVFFVTNSAMVSRASMLKKMQSEHYKYKGAKLDTLYPSSAIAA